MTDDSKNLSDRMRRLIDQELVARAGVQPEAEAQEGEDTASPEASLEARLAADVWRLAAGALGMSEAELDPQENLANLGIDSIAITEVMAKISRHFGISVAPTTFFEARHLNDLSNILLARYRAPIAARYAQERPQEPEQTAKTPPAPVPSAPPPAPSGPAPAGDETDAWLVRHRAAAQPAVPAPVARPAAEKAESSADVPIAILSMDGKFAKSPDLDALQAHLAAGDDCMEVVPPERWDWRAVDGDPKKGPFTNVKYGGFVDGVDLFDAAFFHISPREAELMDPQHRLFLECAWSVIEKAGYAPGSLSGRKVGIFLGIDLLDYMQMVNRDGSLDPQQMTGLGHTFCPNRLSFLLDVHGPSEAIDTACSSSLVAVHRAVMAIRHEGCEMALAGGANLMLSPLQHILFSRIGMLAPDGRCKTFAAAANGYARADGVGAVLLKRLDAAEADGDPILGVIRGSAEHHGGGATSLTAPNPKAQARLIVEAHRAAGTDPRTIGLIECHGTGTPLGDPIEAEGLRRAFAELYEDRGIVLPAAPTVGLGSIKSNIGHTETAAGVAGLIKVLLAMRTGTRFQTLHCAEPNPLLELEQSPFFLLQEAAPWERPVVDGAEQPRRAGLSSFGAGGANVHMVIEEYREARPVGAAAIDGPLVVPVSAASEPALKDAVARLRNAATDADFASLACTLQVGRDAMRCRAAFVASDRADLIGRMDAFLAGDGDAAFAGRVASGRKDDAPALDPARADPAGIARHWAAGGAVDWQNLWAGETPRRIALPSYPFQRKRFWLPQAETPPVLLTPTSDGQGCYSLRLTGREMFLADHRVGGTPVFPGVAYLELARSAAVADGIADPVLRKIVWMAPLKVEAPVTVVCEIDRRDDGSIRAEISSHAGDGVREVHAQMRIAPSGGGSRRPVDLAALRAAPARHVDRAAVYGAFDAMGLHYGTAHRAIADLAVAEGVVLARLELPEAFKGTLKDFCLHPSLMDGAFQSAIGLSLDADGRGASVASLPFSLATCEMFGPLEPAMWAHVRAAADAGGGLQKADIDLIAGDGTVRVAMTGFIARELAPAATGTSGSENGALRFVPVWKPFSPATDQPVFSRRIVFLADGALDRGVLGARLPDRDIRVFDAALPLADRFIGLCREVMAAAQEALAAPGDQAILIQVVLPDDDLAAPLGGIAGMLKSIHREHRRFHGLVLRGASDAMTLATALEVTEAAPAGALMRLAPAGLEIETIEAAGVFGAAPPPWKDGGVYLITGGTGALARRLADAALAHAQAAKIILAGRRPADAPLAAHIDATENLFYEVADIADDHAVAALVERIRTAHGRLDGVVHTAGTLRDGAILRKTGADLDAVLAPKVRGALALDAATGDASLDFFVLFASVAGVSGNMGQADYAAANAFLDGFAKMREARRARGLCHGRTVSIAWPLWADGGMRIGAAQEDLMRRVTGLEALEAGAGIAAFDAAVAGDGPRTIVATGDAVRIEAFLAGAEPEAAPEPRRAEVAAPAAPNAGTLHRPVLAALIDEAAAQLKVSVEDLEPDVELTEYGFDSIGFTQFANRLNDRFGLELTPPLFFEYPTLDGLAGHLAEAEPEALAKALGIAATPAPKTEPAEAPTTVTPAPHPLPSAAPVRVPDPQTAPDAIAIIGMSCRFPGAPDIDGFWDVLESERDCICEVPAERWDWRAYWGDPLREPGRANVKSGGFLENIAGFDAAFFGISPPEARMMDPQQRLLLTEAWRVMEDSGYPPSALAGSKTGVFVGTADAGYGRLISEAGLGVEGYTMTGLAPSIGPNRLSYHFDFHGPSVAVETACSSALVAVHRAVEALRSGHCTAAIAGGVGVLLLPEAFVGFAKAGMLAPDGRCKPFSAAANGYARGEGIGLVFLKPLAEAVRDGDRIHGVIRASAENHGGHAASLTAPNPKAQADLLRTAYRAAGIDPRTVGYIEAHGTGTPLGDPIEVEALTAAFADLDREAEERFGPMPEAFEHRCLLGSVKSNIGHLEIAAGIAGLIKVLLQIRHGTIARSLHAEALNPYLKLEGGPFRIAQEKTEWRPVVGSDGSPLPRRAGVSSFGFGGSNAHVVIEEFLAPAPAGPEAGAPQLIVLSAKTAAQLTESAARLHAFLEKTEARLDDTAWTLQVAREPMRHRLGFLARDRADLSANLASIAAGNAGAGVVAGEVKSGRKLLSVLENDGPLAEAAAGLAGRGRPDDLLALWVGGFNVDWKKAWRGPEARRISLPGYPFAKTPYWVGTSPANKPASPEPTQPKPNLSQTLTGNESFLRDHVVTGKKLLPGVVAFELVRRALEGAGVGGGFELVGHGWVGPVAVDETPVRLDVTLEEGGAQGQAYRLSADGARHAEGVARPLSEMAPRIDIDAARAAAPEPVDTASLYRRFADTGLEYGPAQRAIVEARRGPGIAVARLQRPADADGGFDLDPAILDGALQAVALLADDTNALALPYAVRRVAVFGATGPVMWAVVGGGDKGASIDVCDEAGMVAVRLEDFVARPVAASAGTGSAPAAPAAPATKDLSDEDRHAAALRLVTEIAARTLEVEPDVLDVDTELGDFGFDSITMTAFASRINAELGLALTPADFFEFATLARLSDHIAGDLEPEQLGLEAASAPLAEQLAPAPIVPVGFEAKPAASAHAGADDPIAIVGMSCAFPMADDPDAFWENLAAGRDCITRIPPDRWSWQDVDGDPKTDPTKTNVHWGGFTDGVFEFDPLFFAISPREARMMDPQQRLMLPHAWKAIEDAGHSPRSFAGKRVGVFVGTSFSGYRASLGEDTGGEGYVATGIVPSVGPNRISYLLDLHGPSEPVETACSSSLVALHRAVQAIRAGDCEAALVGGVNTIVTPDAHINYAKAGMLAPDGRCKTFSDRADGYGRGEGVGMLFVRRLCDAERDGDPILAVVRGTAVNHGGHANSLTAPNTEAQADLIRTAWMRAAIDPRTIGYVEAHGTGTALGDPVEINALKSAFRDLPKGEDKLEGTGCGLGSVKTNIGHLELAAGAAGLVKILQQFRYGKIAPSIHCETVNPFIDLDGTPFRIVRDLEDWHPVRDAAGTPLPRRAGISSFGFGGVNAHAVLEEYRPQEARAIGPDGPVVIVLSARDAARLTENAGNLLAFLDRGDIGEADLGDLATTLQVGRTPMAERLAIVAESLAELRDKLAAWLAGGASDAVRTGRADPRAAADGPLGADAAPEQIAAHWVAGGAVDWGKPKRRLRLPTYPFARDIFRAAPEYKAAAATAPSPAVSTPAVSADGGTEKAVRLDADAFYLRDHRIRGARILPGAMALELIRETAEPVLPQAGSMILSRIAWRRPVQLDAGERDIRIVLSKGDADLFKARLVDGETDAVTCDVSAGAGTPGRLDVDALKSRCADLRDPDWLYASYAASGIDYGPAFRAVAGLWSGDAEVLARLTLPRAADAGAYHLHPSILDAAFHASLPLFAGKGTSGLALPVAIDRMEIFGATGPEMWAHLRLAPSGTGVSRVDIDLADGTGKTCVRIEGFTLRAVPDRKDTPRVATSSPENAPATDLRRAAEAYFVGLVARETEIDPAAISVAAPLEDYGIDSVMIARLTDALERDFGPLSKTLFFEYQTLEAVIGHFLESHADRLAEIVGAGAAHVAPAPTPLPARPKHPADAPVAIIGLAGRYPGARNVAEFWENLKAGRDCVTEVPAARWDHASLYDPERKPGRTTGKWGGFVDGFDRFDPMFFNIAPREAAYMDPQERLFLQCAFETLEDAGYTRATAAPPRPGLSGADVGVFVGVMYEEYQLYGPERTAAGAPTAITGSAASIANRVSYFCNFQGPSLAVDSMCSSSLTAIHLACDALRGGGCSVALAGGVNLTLHPNKYLALSQGRFLSSKGRCESFGEGGDGYVPAEGVGAVLLKPLDAAEADGDRIYGVILGSALNHGGKTNGYTVPNPPAQTDVVTAALTRAGVAPDEIGVIEAHGTGTSLGDPIEIAALSRAFAGRTTPLPVGSVKSNIGHGESAAGIAGLTKLLLQLRNGQLVPSLHAEPLNPNIDFAATPFRVQKTLEDWPRQVEDGRERPRIGGLSSFGAGGANAHLVVAEYVDAAPPAAVHGPQIYPFSARDPERLAALLANFRTALERIAEPDMPSVASTLQEGREAFEERLAIVADGKADLAAKLDRVIAGALDHPGIFRGRAALNAPTAEPGATLDEVAAAWVAGATVDWAARRTGPRPRPISLPTYPFADDRYWLPEIDAPPLRAGETPVSPDAPLPLLFEPVFEEKAATDGTAPQNRIVVLCGLSEGHPGLAEALRASGAECVVFDEPEFADHAARLLALLKGTVRDRRNTLVQVVVPATGEGSALEGLGGMLRSAAFEHRSLAGQLIAVDGATPDLVARLARDAHAREDIVIRHVAGRRLVRTWRDWKPAEGGKKPWREGGVYLLTGGAGGIGRHVAQAIAASGVRPSLWLTGRSPETPDIATWRRELDTLGAAARYRSLDVTDADAVAALLVEIEAEDGRLDGVFHGAGILRDGLMAGKDGATLRAVLAPKVTGTEVLDAALGRRSLDFFVLFASAAGALGNPGQTDYAAANAFLDRFAAIRNDRVAAGLCHGRTLSIDWPYWRGGGMRLDAAAIAAMEKAGVRPLDTGPAIAALECFLADPAPDQVLVLEGDKDRLRTMIGAAPRATAAPKLLAAPSPARRAEPARTDRTPVLEKILAAFSACLGVPRDRLDPEATIDRFGVDSVSALEIVEALEKDFGPLSQTILFECQTIARLADELAECADTPPPDPAPERAAAPQMSPDRDDIAIIAVAGRYPGTDTIEAFAEALRAGRDLVTEVPPERAGLVPRFSDKRGAPGASHCKWGGFLSDVDRFDAAFFGYSPKAADLADPQERLFLETAWHLFERAGHTRDRLKNAYDGRVGVFVGAMYQHYASLAADPEVRALTSLSSYSAIANRVSFFFDLKGPSVAVDSMCSSGLQAVHQACQSLRSGECRLTVAGGVNLSIAPGKFEGLSRAGLAASSPESRAFAGGDGYLPAEGVGAVLLKPMADARRDGDLVLAVIRGSLANHSGHSAGYAVPNVDAEVRLMADAFAAAGVAPDTIDYVEAAATGAELGDAIELKALAKVYAGRKVPLGSVKANMGHAEAASGLAQLTKVLLQFERGELFPMPGLACREEAFRGTPLVPQTELAPWPAPEGGRPRRAAISSFGAGGSNVHLILEEAPPQAVTNGEERRPRRFPLSARTAGQLGEMRRRLAAFLRESGPVSMEALAHTLQHGREAFDRRIDIVATDSLELAEKLENEAYRESAEALATAGDVSDTGPMLVLPGYPFARERHWVAEMGEAGEARPAEQPRPAVPERTLLDLILATLSAELGVPLEEIDADATFDALGVDSMARTRLFYAVEEATGTELSRADLAAHSSPRALADHLAERAPAAAPEAAEDGFRSVRPSDYRCPLGPGQTGLWVWQKLHPESGAYNVPLAFRCRALDVAALERALEFLVTRYPLLGCRVDEAAGAPVLLPRAEGIAVATVAMPKEIETEAFLRQRALMPFDLGREVLRVEHLSGGRLDAPESVVLILAHHIVTDGVSSAVIARDFWQAYARFTNGEKCADRSIANADYADFVDWETALAEAPEGAAQKAYWLEKFAGPLPSATLPAGEGGSRSRSLDPTLSADLRDAAKTREISAASLYLAAFAALVYRYTGEADLVIGVPTLRRSSRRFAETVGYCANMIALRLAVDPAASFSDFARSVHEELAQGLANSDVAFAEIARQIGGTATGTAPFAITFAYQNFAAADEMPEVFAAGDVEHLSAIRQATDATLSLEIEDGAAGAAVHADAAEGGPGAAALERLLGHFGELLKAVLNAPETPVADLPMLTGPERDRALHHWSRTGRSEPFAGPIHGRILDVARRSPSATAIVAGAERVTWRDLAARARRVAVALSRQGIGKADRVAVLAPRGPDAVAALLGVMSLGAVWVPLDPDLPDQRLGFIVKDAGAATVLAGEALAERARKIAAGVPVVVPGSGGLRARFVRPPEPEIGADDPAYIIYTSGSTGTPKGVVVSHGALAHHCAVIADEFGLTERDAVLQFASLSVDTAIEQMLPVLIRGGRLVLRPAELPAPAAFLNFLRAAAITVADLPPVYLGELLAAWERSRANRSALPLRLMIVGGDVLSPQIAEAWARSGIAGARLVNAYGPTEATITALTHTVRPNGGPVPIGRPLPGTEIYILDAGGHPVPDGIVGELHIGGPRLALGYHGRPDLTGERFRTHDLPHKSLPLYATGDRASFVPNSGGVVAFHGRIDDQVKIRGHRIEPGEVEAAFAACGIGEAAVVVESGGGAPVLTAVVAAPEEGFDEAALRARLAERLPAPMVPAAIVRRDRLPKTPGGKIDRRALKGTRPGRTAARPATPPRDDIERKLSDIWAEALGAPEGGQDIGIDDDFASRGGNSLTAVRLLARVEEAFGRGLSVRDLEAASTIAAQARLLRGRGVTGAARTAGPPRLLVSLGQPAPGSAAEKVPPLFLVHPVGGTLSCYGPLLSAMQPARPVYGLRAAGLEAGEAVAEGGLADMATAYCRELRNVQPRGPYSLAGWSFGGVVAYEMARQLEASGETIAVTALLDSYTPADLAALDGDDPDTACRRAFVRDLFGADADIRADDDIVATVMALPQFSAVLPGADRETVERLYKVFAANHAALAAYVPEPSTAPLTLVRATSGSPVKGAGSWSALARGRLSVHRIDADHYGLMRPPHVAELAQVLGDTVATGEPAASQE
ncbi:non-ribosomal peptide synthetase [Rhodobium gokarnense]|uniref:Amino acid adenylation domain-containing protein n=1 Tax=Rhodobium gokarnense TaxID=364296 RepID=A0ABT3H881_9HYPH|nr:non-ribosomal peptide synthetase [Rhodobium gokarnense]MCW2306578.1 amino acid adenylation domain-containing protein [Rhodobium gokarnense]